MSWNPLLDPIIPTGNAVDAIDTVIIARARDLGGFEVRRALPSVHRQMVGPFIFFDQMGPAEFLTGQGVDVRPHPHIGLSTVTYLLQGQMHHRDSIGTNRQINVGDVAVMQSGIGITHSERSDNRDRPQPLFGLQTWLALTDEDAAPNYHQTAALPTLSADGIDLRLILGTAYGQSAPTPLQSETFYADVTLAPNAAFPLPDHEDRGIYILSGSVTEGAQTYDAGAMLIYRPGDQISVRAGGQGARLVALGGATMAGPRHLWWNFVASSRERIDAAREAWRAGDWAHGRFQLPPDDDAEFIPAPEK